MIVSETATYSSWKHMRQRCNNPNHKAYRYYGGRGITICERWDSFENFLADMGEMPVAGMTIERIHNEEGYKPGNCRWATRLEQAQNTKLVSPYVYKGKPYSLCALARLVAIAPMTLRYRLVKMQLPVEMAIKEKPDLCLGVRTK